MPQILDEADGSQDGQCKSSGWRTRRLGECEASPLTSINFICPKSHSAANPIRDSILGKNLNNLDDIKKIIHTVKHRSLMIAQTPHTFSGISGSSRFISKKRKLSNLFFTGMKKIFPKLLMPQYYLERHLKILMK